MDPTRTFCRIDFNSSPIECRKVITNNIKKLSLIGKNLPSLIKNKDLITVTKNNDISTDVEDPFLNIELFPFNNISAYTLASIDLYFDITHHGSGLIAPQLLRFQNYIISGSEDIGMFEYIQYRNIMSFAYFFESTGSSGGSGVSGSNINTDRILEVKDHNKYRYSNIDFYITKVLNIDSKGVDVFIIQDYISDVELIHQLIIMLKSLKIGGSAIILIKNDELLSDIISLLSVTFDYISLFKPCTIGLYNNTYYLICKYYKQKNGSDNSPRGIKDVSIIVSLLNDIIKRVDYDKNIKRILRDTDNKIVDYITSIESIINDEISNDRDGVYVSSKLKMYLNLA